ncbi:MAG: glycosyltransferase, partial [Candidatus Nanopelagicales bacterium]
RVLCLPSAREGMPNVVLEAASVGVPAIVSNATGARDSVEDGHTGLVFRRGDVTALADALEVFVGDAAIAKAMGEAAREFVTREFAREVVWDRYERVFRSLFETIGKSNRVTFEIP